MICPEMIPRLSELRRQIATSTYPVDQLIDAACARMLARCRRDYLADADRNALQPRHGHGRNGRGS